ncbi:unnamed protein product [Durusdinium trenchii]|uniref:Uncharacterized protein n=1 Tax=Durusdinium trenchii TaxID=1381693 RepID=A0ABP0I294_9DINO
MKTVLSPLCPPGPKPQKRRPRPAEAISSVSPATNELPGSFSPDKQPVRATRASPKVDVVDAPDLTSPSAKPVAVRGACSDQVDEEVSDLSLVVLSSSGREKNKVRFMVDPPDAEPVLLTLAELGRRHQQKFEARGVHY